MNAQRENDLLEMSRRNPFWVCLLVFAMIAVDGGQRLVSAVRQKQQLENEAQNQRNQIGQMAPTLQQLPKMEAALKALSLDLLGVAKTNAAAAKIVKDFNIQWTPGPEEVAAAAAAPTAPPVGPEAPLKAAPSTNAPPVR